MRSRLPLSPLLAAIAFTLVLFLASPALAFDGGYHVELTRDAMQGSSYGQTPIQVAQVANWYDDGFESAKAVISEDPTSFTIPLDWIGLGDINYPGVSAAWGQRFGPASVRDLSDVYLHFDQLADNSQVSAAWDRLVKNTHRAVLAAQAANDPLGYLTVMGATMHAVQDFYSHSNWAELTEAGAWGGDATWFDVKASVRDTKYIYTHHAATGSIPAVGHDVLNKDWSEHAYFPTAYREAYYASDQWVHLLDSWITPAFKDQVLAASAPGVDLEYEFVRYLTWYAGHWKGPHSTSWDDYVIVGPDYLRDSNQDYLNKWKQYTPLICADPAPAETFTMLVVYPETIGWVEIVTNQVSQTDQCLIDIDPFGEADFYAYVGVNDRDYLTPMHEDADTIYPDDWYILAPIDPGPGSQWVNFKYDLWDEDAPGPGATNWMTLRGDDDHCDIVRELGKTIFYGAAGADDLAQIVNFTTDGQIYDAGFFESDGDGNEAVVSFNATWLEPARRPFQTDIHSDPRSTTPPRPSAPLVTDDGLWTNSRTYLHATWTVPGGSEYNPVTEYRYRISRRENEILSSGIYSQINDWTSAGTDRLANIDGLALTEGWIYYIEVQARNAGGWSETGRSDGVILDAVPPVMQSLSLMQQTLAKSGPTREQGLLPPGGGSGSGLPGGSLLNPGGPAGPSYPNSLAIVPVATDPGGLMDSSGLWGYVIWMSDLTRQTHGPDKGDKIPHTEEVYGPSQGAHVPLGSLNNGVLEFVDVPLLDGKTYSIRVAPRDWAGNEGAQLSGEVTVSFSDTTPPPAPAPRTEARADADSPLTVSWDEVFDPESGIYEYLVAVGSYSSTPDNPNVVPWTSVGRDTSFDIPGVDPHANSTYVNIWVKAKNGKGLESLVGSVVYQTESGVFARPDMFPPVAANAPIRVVVLGKRLTMDTVPTMVNGRVLVPMRFIFEALGAKVDWRQATQTVIGTRGSVTIRLTVGQAVGYVNGIPVKLDAAAQMINGRVFVPLRFIAEALDCDVKWNGPQRAVIVE